MRAQVFVRRIAPANSLNSLLPKGSARGCFLHHITVLLVIYYWLFSLLQDLQDHWEWVANSLSALQSFHCFHGFSPCESSKACRAKMKRRNVRTLSLIVVTFTYLLIGAAIFDVLEGPTDEETYDGLLQVRKDFIAKYNMTEDDYKMLEIIIIGEFWRFYFDNFYKEFFFTEKQPHKAGPQWKFAGSFYYALVVLSLIGYGHSTPKTLLGTWSNILFFVALQLHLALKLFSSPKLSWSEPTKNIFWSCFPKHHFCCHKNRVKHYCWLMMMLLYLTQVKSLGRLILFLVLQAKVLPWVMLCWAFPFQWWCFNRWVSEWTKPLSSSSKPFESGEAWEELRCRSSILSWLRASLPASLYHLGPCSFIRRKDGPFSIPSITAL